MQSDTQCAYVSVRTGSVIGHQMVTVWAGPQQAKKKKKKWAGVGCEGGSSLLTPFPFSHAHPKNTHAEMHAVDGESDG